MIQIIQCPACHENDLFSVFPSKDYVVTGELFDILECSHCRLRITNPFPDEKEIGRYYESGAYLPHSEEFTGTVNSLYGHVQHLMLYRKRKLVESLTGGSNGTLFDVGCGAGAFLNEMNHAGWDVNGVDSNERARETAHKKYGIQVYSPDDWFARGGLKADVITFWHSLEHIHNLDGYLNGIRSDLKEKGFLLIAIPNYESYDGRYYQSRWAAYDAPRHLYHFTYGSLNILLQRYGLMIVTLRRLPFDSFYISMLSEKNREGSLARGLWVGLRSYLQSLSDPKRSSSIVYIVTKGNRTKGQGV